MELIDDRCGQGLKRKTPENGNYELLNNFFLDDLNEDLLERILSWLPTSTFFRLTSLCKRWKSVASSSSFKLACSHIPSREPWFLMVAPNQNQPVIFDSAQSTWKRLNHPLLLQEESNQSCMPVAASGGLICYRNLAGNFVVSNPVTGSCSEIPPLHFASQQHQPLNAIVMSTFSKDQFSYKIVLVFGELPNLMFKVYNSSSGCWEDEAALRRRVDDNSLEYDSSDDNVVYFLSKAGTVVASNMQRSPSKQYSSVITTNKDGEEVVHFLSSSGKVVACNLTCNCFLEYPRLLPVFSEYSIDIVECNGEMLVVLLSEFLESASLRVWKYDEDNRGWHQIAAMPAAMSHDWYGKKADINCVGAGNQIFICLNFSELCSYILCDLVNNKWVELPNCCINGQVMDFMSAFSFEPRIEASV